METKTPAGTIVLDEAENQSFWVSNLDINLEKGKICRTIPQPSWRRRIRVQANQQNSKRATRLGLRAQGLFFGLRYLGAAPAPGLDKWKCLDTGRAACVWETPAAVGHIRRRGPVNYRRRPPTLLAVPAPAVMPITK